ncbi:MAG: MarR family winged helix-turn-helix transcriptional regulator [Hyphomicrobiales bacterium]
MADLENLPSDISKDDFVGNTVGAFAYALTDKVELAWTTLTGRGVTTCYAINQIGSEPGSSIKTLTGMLNIEHSSIVRLLDGLERDGLIERRMDHEDRRGKKVHLSTAGEELLTEMLNARRRVLEPMTGVLDDNEMQTLFNLLEKMMPAVVIGGTDQHFVCRVCELEMCPQEICAVNGCFEEWKDEAPEQGFRRPLGSRRGPIVPISANSKQADKQRSVA